MKLLHHLLASAVCVAILAATSTPVSAHAVDMAHRRSTKGNNVPKLPRGGDDSDDDKVFPGSNDSDDDSEVFPGSADSDDSSELALPLSKEEIDDSSEVVPGADAEPKRDHYVYDEIRRLEASAAPASKTPDLRAEEHDKPWKTPEAPKSTNSTATPTGMKPSNATALPRPSKPVNATALPSDTPKSPPTNVPPTKTPTPAK